MTSTTGKLSQYDLLLKRYAPELNWDWRLLASQTFQESRFKPNARSWAGAIRRNLTLSLSPRENLLMMKNPHKVAIGSDHAGYEAKELVKRELTARGVEVVDEGAYGLDSVDYPDFGAAVGRAVASGEVERGVLICGSGIGISMAANKVPGVRAALCWNEETARLAREHNDANILCFGARFIQPDLAARMVSVFMETEFAGGRHAGRVEKLSQLDRSKEER